MFENIIITPLGKDTGLEEWRLEYRHVTYGGNFIPGDAIQSELCCFDDECIFIRKEEHIFGTGESHQYIDSDECLLSIIPKQEYVLLKLKNGSNPYTSISMNHLIYDCELADDNESLSLITRQTYDAYMERVNV